MNITQSLTYALLLTLSIIQGCGFEDIPDANHIDPAEFKFIGQAVLPTGLMFQKTEVGGLSAITYDRANDIYYAISDDKGFKQPARFYTMKIDLSTGRLNNETVTLTDVTFVRMENGEVYEPGTVDFEGIAIAGDGNLFLSSEAITHPMIAKYGKDGHFIKSLPVPEKFLPDEEKTKGIRHNLGFESLTISQDGEFLTTAVENAIVQDGPSVTANNNTLCRTIIYRLEEETAVTEKLYLTDKNIDLDVTPGNTFVSGLVELQSTPDDLVYFALERTYSADTGHTIKLFRIDVEGSTDISSIEALANKQYKSQINPIEKKLVMDFSKLGIPLDNIEGMTFGPQLPDGTQSLIFISDNNFNPEQFTQILAFSLSLTK